jgi:D-alanyl-D-alanine carboxypeptidase (penicillin-binding protein 5/6)
MAKELMKHPQIYNYTTIWTDYLRGGETQLANTNKLLRSYNGITGLKTGTTSGAGVCICATAKRNDLSLIAVVLGSDSSRERFSAAKKLLDFGFANFETKPFPQINDLPKEIAVKLGTQKQAKISCDIPDALLFVKGATTSLTCRTELPQYIDAPMFRDMKIGSVSLYSGQGKIKEYDIVLEEDVEKIDFVKALSILTKNIVQL